MVAEIPTAVKIIAVVIVASWACAGAIRLLYPGVWKWFIEKISIIWRPCSLCYHHLFPEAYLEQNQLKHHYVLPMSISDGDRESFSKSFSENTRRRKSEGSLRLERRNTELNLEIPTLQSAESLNIDPETPNSSQSETKNLGQSKTKKEGRRRGQGWVRGGSGGGRGRIGRGRLTRESGFDYPFNHPNYDFPPPDRIRGPSQFDILNPLQPRVNNPELFDEGPKKSTKKLYRSYSTNTTSFPNDSKTNSSKKSRKSDVYPQPTPSVDNLLDL